MSKVTTIKNYLDTLVAGALTGYFQLPDNLATEDNTNTYLEKGFAVSYGPGVNDSANFCQGEILISRGYDIRLTNIYVPNNDETYRGSLESALMEDLFLILTAIQADVLLGGNAFDSIPEGDTGIQYLVDEAQEQIITTALTLTVRYRETF